MYEAGDAILKQVNRFQSNPGSSNPDGVFNAEVPPESQDSAEPSTPVYGHGKISTQRLSLFGVIDLFRAFQMLCLTWRDIIAHL